MYLYYYFSVILPYRFLLCPFPPSYYNMTNFLRHPDQDGCLLIGDSHDKISEQSNCMRQYSNQTGPLVFFNYLPFQSIDFEGNWGRLFQKLVMRTTLKIGFFYDTSDNTKSLKWDRMWHNLMSLLTHILKYSISADLD